jgi:hypothetical protein
MNTTLDAHPPTPARAIHGEHRRTRDSRLVALAATLLCGAAAAQELEPRAFSASPIGTTFVLGGFGKSDGAIVYDDSLDIDNVHADLDIVTTGFGRTFAWGARQARVLAVFPYADGGIVGDVGGAPQSAKLSGLADPRIKVSIGLRGAPALTPSQFARAPRRTVVGASLTVMPPWGDYEPERLVNLGYNRWALKPEIGVSHPRGPWTFEGSVGAWAYSRNSAQYPGAAHKRQEPLVSAQAHVSYAWPSRAWLALDATSFSGGKTRVDGIPSPDYQSNSRVGITLSIPLGAHQSVKLVYSEGAATRRGTDFDSFTATWQLVRF